MNKAIDMLIDEAALIACETEGERLQIPDGDIQFSKEHEAKMKKLFRKEKRKVAFKKFSKYSKGVACVLLAFAVISGAAVFCVAEWRTKVLNFVFDEKTTHTEIGFIDNDNSIIIDKIQFNYIPEGFEVTEKSVSKISTYVTFRNETTNIGFYKTTINVKKGIDTENAVVKNITVNGMEGIISIKDTVIILVWHDENYMYTLTSSGENSPISEEEIMKIARNIRIR